MSNHDTSLGAVFELQRTTIKQTGALVETTLSVPSAAGEQLAVSGEAGREMRTRLLDLSRKSVHSSLEVAGSLQGEEPELDELQDSIDELFDRLDEQHDTASQTVDAEYERFEDDLTEAIDSQLDALLDAHEELESQLFDLLEGGESAESETAPDGEVTCRVCGDSFAAITHPHLQTHDMTISEYRAEYGDDVLLRPDEN